MRWYVVLAVFVLLAGSAGPATAQHARDYGRGHVRSGHVLPLDQILPNIRNSRPGTFYDAEGPFRGPDGRMHYSLKWMTPSGRIIWLDTDAGTGRVLGEMHGQRAPRWEGGRRYVPRQDNRRHNYGGRQKRDNWNDRSSRGYYRRGGDDDRGRGNDQDYDRRHRH